MVFLLTSFLAAATYVVATAFLRDNQKLTTIQVKKQIVQIKNSISNPGELVFKDKERILILCLGLDENRDLKGIGYTKGSRTDTIFILALDRKARRLGILSIPRDTWVYISDYYGYGKINSVYAEAFWSAYQESNHDYEQAELAGIIQARKTIEEFLDVEIDYYVLLKIRASIELIDALGGINVNVEKDMDYDDNWGNLHIHLKKGRHRLTGEEAIGYARFRHDEEGDWGRIRRQQQVIQALMRELKKPVHIMHVREIARVAKRNLDTDLTVPELIDLANVYKNFNQSRISKGVITGYDDWAGGMMILVPHEEETKRLVRRVLRNPSDILPEEIRIRVINGSSIPGLAEEVVEDLQRENFVVIRQEYDGEEFAPFSRIIDHYNNPTGIKVVENSLGFKFTKKTKQLNEQLVWPLDFTIVLGDDYYEHLQYLEAQREKLPVPRIDSGEDRGRFEVKTIQPEGEDAIEEPGNEKELNREPETGDNERYSY